MQKMAFTNGLLKQLQHFAKDKIHSNKDVQESCIYKDQHISYPVKTAEYNEAIAQNIQIFFLMKWMTKMNMMLM